MRDSGSFGARFGRLVKARRGAKRFTQAFVAERAFGPRADKARISDLERGKVPNPHQSTVDAVAEVLEISEDEILACYSGGAPGQQLQGPEQKQLHDLYPNSGMAFSFRRKVANFNEEYLLSERGRVPFGGRESEIADLNQWLNSNATPSRFLLTAPAGRGKSALLVRWLERISLSRQHGETDWQVAFVPISIRVGTNRPEDYYQGLALRLSEITGVALADAIQRDADFYKASIRNQLELSVGREFRLLVVIDGVDEALEGSFDTTIFPKLLPKTLRILVSCRWQVGDVDSSGWLRRLSWDHETRVITRELEKLGADGIADVLVQQGAPVDVLASDPQLVAKLSRLTEGEPLLIRYYASDLWDITLTGARIGVDDLDVLKPGFGSYFQRWMEQQERLWAEEGGEADAKKIDSVLVILSHAKGPLTEVDLLALMKKVHGEDFGIVSSRLLRPLRRFVMGSGKANAGYVLSHPKIGQHLRLERFQAAERYMRETFASWGREQLQSVNDGIIKPEHASRYLLLYLTQHLVDAEAPPELYLAMVENGWRKAWQEYEGGPRGFASAVQQAENACRRQSLAKYLGQIWRCVLVRSSVLNLGRNIPGPLVVCMLKDGTLTEAQARHYVELNSEPTEVATTFAVIWGRPILYAQKDYWW